MLKMGLSQKHSARKNRFSGVFPKLVNRKRDTHKTFGFEEMGLDFCSDGKPKSKSLSGIF